MNFYRNTNLDKHKIIQLINVCFDLSETGILKREINGLDEAMKNLKTETAMVINAGMKIR